MNETIRRMRTIKQMVEEIKKDDPESSVTRYMLKSIIESNQIHFLFG